MKPLPHDTHAEMTVIGFMLFGQHMAAILAELVPEDFYVTANRTIAAACVELFKDGDPVDALTVAEYLERAGTLKAAGGRSYLSDCVGMAFSDAMLDGAVSIVKDSALLRHGYSATVNASGKFANPGERAEDLIVELQSNLLNLTARNNRTKTIESNVALQSAFSHLDAADPAVAAGIATGFADLDFKTGGLQRGELIILAARPSMGKAQPLCEPVLTPGGFISMGDIVPGMSVIGSDGYPCRVNGVFPQGMKQVYNVEFSDGSFTRCTDDHLWLTQTRNERRFGSVWSVKTLREIRDTLKIENGARNNHIVPLVSPVEFDGQQEPIIHPWLMGALLGDGTLGRGSVLFDKPERDVQDKIIELLPIEDCGTCRGQRIRIKRRVRTKEPSETRKALNALGLCCPSHEKFIPEMYLLGSVHTRLQVLIGLMDTDASVVNPTTIEYSTSSAKLADQVVFLVRSLGGMCSRTSRTPHYSHLRERRIGRVSERINIWFDNGIIPVSSKKHLARFKRNVATRHTHRSIVNITPHGLEECQCISVSASNGLYITRDFILTHNTSLMLNIASNVAKRGRKVYIFTLEMTAKALSWRLLFSEAKVDMHLGKTGRLREPGYSDELQQVHSAFARLQNLPIYYNETSFNIMEMVSFAQREAITRGIDLLCVDYLGLAHSGLRGISRNDEVGFMTGALKRLSKELNIPTLCLSQLSRVNENQVSKRPTLNALRDSGNIEQDADMVLFIHSDQYYADKSQGVPDNWESSVIIAKQRNGPTGEIVMDYCRPYTRFFGRAREDDKKDIRVIDYVYN